MTLPTLFDLSLVGRRERPALEWEELRLTFGEIDDRASRMANLLAGRGLKPGDRLCVYLANCLEYIDLFLAATRLGVIFVPVNILYREREISHILQDAGPAAIVASEASSPYVPAIAPVWRVEELQFEA